MQSVRIITNTTDRHDITEILLKVALNTISQTKPAITKHVLFLNRFHFHIDPDLLRLENNREHGQRT